MKTRQTVDSIRQSIKKISAPYARPLHIFFISAAIAVGIYLLFVGSAAYVIYKRHTTNGYTNLAEKVFPYPAAIANHEIISLKRFRLEVSARNTYSSLHGLDSSEAQNEQLVSTQLVNRTLYAQTLKSNGLTVSEADVDKEMDQIYKQVDGQDQLTKFLHDNYGSEIGVPEFRTWVKESLIESAVKQQLLQHATVQHLLISVPDNATPDQVEAARQKILGIKASITTVDQFSAAAKQYSEDVASRDKNGELGVTTRGDDEPVISADFEKAIFTLPLNTVSDPIRSKFGWHLIYVTDRGGKIQESMKTYTNELRNGHTSVFIGN